MSGARADTWMPLYWGDYLKDTGRLSTEGHGAYLLLIADYWTSGGPLPDDDDQLAAITRLPLARWQKLRRVLEHFFQISDGVWRHGRVDREIEQATAITEIRSSAGTAGANARWSHKQRRGNRIGNRTPEPLSNVKQNDAPSPSQSPKEESEAIASSLPAIDPKREIFGKCLQWLAKATGEAPTNLRSLIGKWLKNYGDAAVLSAFQEASHNPPIDPKAWIIAALETSIKPRGSNNERRLSPADALALGTAQALADRERARDCGPGDDLAEPLLDSGGLARIPQIANG